MDVVDLWRMRTSAADADLPALLAVLSSDEHARAESRHTAAARRSFVVGRARLRQLLAHCLGGEAAVIRLTAGPAGKPIVSGAPPDFDFSVSRHGDLQVCAVATGRRVGVDIEPIDEARDALSIARIYFTAAEAAWLAHLEPAARARAFAGLWTRKEATVKAVGRGLQMPLTSIAVPRESNGPVHVIDDASRGESADWYSVVFTPAPGWTGAVVSERPDWTLREQDWPPR
jgi:4'-phosphopantetheinyl transferase